MAVSLVPMGPSVSVALTDSTFSMTHCKCLGDRNEHSENPGLAVANFAAKALPTNFVDTDIYLALRGRDDSLPYPRRYLRLFGEVTPFKINTGVARFIVSIAPRLAQAI